MHISKKIEMVACPGFLFRIMRKEHKLTLKCLTVDVGMSESHYSKVESGQIIPSMDVNDRMIGFYQLSTCKVYQADFTLEIIDHYLSDICNGHFHLEIWQKWCHIHQESFYLLYPYAMETCVHFLASFRYLTFVDHYKHVIPFKKWLPLRLQALWEACSQLAFSFARDQRQYQQCKQAYEKLNIHDFDEIVQLAKLYMDLNTEQYVSFLENYHQTEAMLSSYWKQELIICKAIYAQRMVQPEVALVLLKKVQTIAKQNAQAMRVDFINGCLGWIYVLCGQYDLAVPYLESTTDLNQIFALAFSYYQLGQLEKIHPLLIYENKGNRVYFLYFQWIRYVIFHPYGKMALSTLLKIEKEYAIHGNNEDISFLYCLLINHFSHCHLEKQSYYYLMQYFQLQNKNMQKRQRLASSLCYNESGDKNESDI